jgi:DNA-binding response OmpR family regulator
MWNEGATSAAHIVVCDDEEEIRTMVADYLRGKGYRVTAADGGASLREAVAEDHVDAVILDVRMPGEDGLSLARFLHEHSNAAILMLTGSAEIIDRIIGLEIGADDYIAKPVELRELLARLKAVLRRTGARERVVEKPEAAAKTAFRFGACTFDMATLRLIDSDGDEIAVTPMEAQLLKVFAEHRGKVLNRDQLLELSHDRETDDPYGRSIDIRVSRLRRKIEMDASKPEVIRTVRGVGYLVM